MTIPIKYDTRYKVTQEIVDEMRRLRDKGLSYQSIADLFGLSSHTPYYWINAKYRKHKREQNSKRVYIPGTEEQKRRTLQHTKRRRELNKLEPIRMRMRIDSAMNEYRCKRHTILGMSIKEYKEKWRKKFSKGSIKIK
jgi:orotate phosphoribosyltransferase-like protein